MLDSVLRVFGSDFDVTAFLNENPFLNNGAEAFRKGEPDLLGSPNLDSGFDVMISENTNPQEHVEEIGEFIRKAQSVLINLKDDEITSVLDIGCSVGIHDAFSQGISLPSELLGLCSALNINIEFSVFPNQDDDNFSI